MKKVNPTLSIGLVTIIGIFTIISSCSNRLELEFEKEYRIENGKDELSLRITDYGLIYIKNVGLSIVQCRFALLQSLSREGSVNLRIWFNNGVEDDSKFVKKADPILNSEIPLL